MSAALKKLFLNDYHKSKHAKFVAFSGYSMPINYELGIIKENKHVRNLVGVFDVSHMGQILIPISPLNTKSLEIFIPLDLNILIFNKSYYSFLLNDKGGIIDDLIISKITIDKQFFYFIVYNASRKSEDEKIFNNYFINHKYLINNSLFAIQGPKSFEVLDFLNFDKNLFFMQNQVIKYFNENIIINRSGYTGEDGFEISIPNNISLKFINQVMENKKSKLCGLGSRDSLRLEAGLSLYGNELDENITPIDAQLAWSINNDRLKDKSLNGQDILSSQLINGSDKIKIGLKPFSKIILRGGMKIINSENNQIGVITSGGYSPSLNCSIGIGYIEVSDFINIKIYVLIRGFIEELKIIKLPFIPHKYKKG